MYCNDLCDSIYCKPKCISRCFQGCNCWEMNNHLFCNEDACCSQTCKCSHFRHKDTLSNYGKKPQPVWTDGYGITRKIQDLTTPHLSAILRWLKDHGQVTEASRRPGHASYRELIQEYQRRI